MSDSHGSKYKRELSPGTQGSNDTGRGKHVKYDKTRRSWSLREEEILRTSLKELVALGWKSDNGFRVGYLNKLEDALRREFPNTDLKVHPNIVSKLTAWKKNYYSLQTILSRSGVGFNLRGDFMIDCEDEQWEQILKVDPNVRQMRNKPWPYLEDWKQIFGKDRANGSNAEDIMEAVNALYSNDNLGNVGVGVDINPEDIFPADRVGESLAKQGPEDSVCQGEEQSAMPKHCGIKRKADEAMEPIYNLLTKMHADTNARLQSLSSRIGYEVDLSNARKEVYDIVGRIPGLALDEKFDVSEMLVKQPDRLDLFMSLPDADRPAYISRLRKEKRKTKG